MELQDILDDEFLVSKTDSKGHITFANEKFCEISKYSAEELIGKPHNIIRHPDMPKTVYEDMWQKIQSGQVWKGQIKNLAKDGTTYWVNSIVYPNQDTNSPHKFISIRTDITQSKIQEDENRTNAAFFEILHLASVDTSLKDFLDQVLVIIMAIPWLSLLDKGGFFLEKGNEYLELVSHRNVSDSLVKMCSKIEYGQCLCGLAAQKREIIFADCVDEKHTNRPEGIQAHGHYNVPLLFQNRLLGVLFLYVQHGHVKKESEVGFLNRLGALLATILTQKMTEEKMTELMTDLRVSNIQAQKQLSRIESLQTLVQQYTSKKVWETAPSALSSHLKELPTEMVRLSFLFCDMKGFTNFSENYEPDVIISTLNEYFHEAVVEIQANDGDVERFMGDAFFAVFEDTLNAAMASAKILAKFKQINADRADQGKMELQFRMGLHTGDVIRGNIGGKTRKEYTVIGDAVNIASRLEKRCDPGRVLISDAVKNELGDKITVSESFSIAVKGKHDKLDVCYLKTIRPGMEK